MNRLIPALLLMLSLSGIAQNQAKESQPQIGKPTGSFFALLVPNVDESARWYREKLGFQFVRKTSGPAGASYIIMLEQDGVLLEIIEHRDSFALPDLTAKRVDLLRGIRKVGLQVSKSDFDRIFHGLTAQKVEFVGGIFEDEGLHMRSFIVRDNAGNLLQFFTESKAQDGGHRN